MSRTAPGSDPALRLGISSVRHVGDDLAHVIADGRPYRDLEDFRRRTRAPLDVLEALATAGAFGCFGLTRRGALWGAGAVAQAGDDRLPGVVTGVHAPRLPGMDEREEALADLWATGVSPDGHPTRFVRRSLDQQGVTPVDRVHELDDGDRVVVGGVVTHRQRPATAGGTTFLNLEDETGLINVIVSKGCWARHRRVARTSPALVVRGRLQKAEGVVNVMAERLEPLLVVGNLSSRDFR